MKADVSAVPKSLVADALNNCTVCRIKAPTQKALIGKPLWSSAIWGRVGIDLIDMSSHPDGEYKWIFHAKDHISKFSYAAPLTSKRCEEVAAAVKHMFHIYGVPQVLQHDRGMEFCGNHMKNMMAEVFPQCKVRNKYHCMVLLSLKANKTIKCSYSLPCSATIYSLSYLIFISRRTRLLCHVEEFEAHYQDGTFNYGSCYLCSSLCLEGQCEGKLTIF